MIRAKGMAEFVRLAFHFRLFAEFAEHLLKDAFRVHPQATFFE